MVKFCRNNRDYLSTFLEFPLQIRKITYTTNLTENVNRGIRKYTKARSILLGDQAIEKAVHLSLMQAKKMGHASKETGHIMLTQFINLFGQERCDLQL